MMLSEYRVLTIRSRYIALIVSNTENQELLTLIVATSGIAGCRYDKNL